MADVHELVKLGVDALDGAAAEELGELGEGGDLEEELDLVDGVAL